MKKNKWKILLLLLIISITGCSQHEDIPSDTDILSDTDIVTEAENMAEQYADIYEKAFYNGTLGSLDITRSMVERLEKCGYTAVDAKNEIDMVNAEQLEVFCEKVTKKENANIAVSLLSEKGGFLRYDLHTEAGKIDVRTSALSWSGLEPQAHIVEAYPADTFTYTEYGYLFIEQYHPSGYDGPSGHTAIRVKPLDKACREYNRKYIEPIGYYNNNMLITEWREEDFGSLNFYDMYEGLYPMMYGIPLPYEANINGDTYEILKSDFEDVIMKYFQIDSQTLQKKTIYDAKKAIYRYHTRGFYDCCSSEYPKPEVIASKVNPDGTITLTVNAIWEWENDDTVFQSEVVIRPLKDGGVQYVSNHIVESYENLEPTWYTCRFSEEEWKEEREEAQKECMDLAEAVVQQTKSIEKVNSITVDMIARKGYAVRGAGIYEELRNYKKMEDFIQNAEKKRMGEVILYMLHTEAGFTRQKFYYDGRDMYCLSTSVSWSGAGKAQIMDSAYYRIKKWSYTEKGWFCYEQCVPEPPEVTEVINGNVMIRIRPMDEKYKEIAETYLYPIGYQGNNLFCSEWNMHHMEELDYNGLYEYLYTLRYKKKLNGESCQQGISGNVFVEMMQQYLPITKKQLEEYAVYDAERNVFAWNKLGCMNYAPNDFGTSIPEVTDMTINKDGTAYITVDAVCEWTGTDRMFSHRLQVKFTEDRGIQYLGNEILGSGLKNIPSYQYRFARTSS